MRTTFPGLSFLIAGLMLLAATAHAAPTEVRDLRQEEANRSLVVGFYDRFFNQHDIGAASVVADGYRQHNPGVPDGKPPFVAYFTDFFKQNPTSTSRIVRTATAGDLVYLHVHFQVAPGDRGYAVIDIFRVDKGRIVEHWDVVQPVPEQAANTNTMF